MKNTTLYHLPPNRMTCATNLDATNLSSMSIAHYLAPPLLADLLLLATQLAEREWIHSALALAALPATWGFVVTGMKDRRQILCRHNAHSGEV